ncbi:helix-turn-helix transcriptional regulator [Peptoclostridium acidaminophilum]|nr:helix-turn-helix domain-containing protein [Peptoclostridium acidaminophilum]
MRKKLKEMRTKSGLTQDKLSKELGISRASYTNIELGLKNPSLSLAIKIKAVLNYSNDDIFLNG